MKKKFLKLLMTAFVMLPCMFIFAACSNSDGETPPETPPPVATPPAVATVNDASIVINNADSKFVLDQDTNAIVYTYGDTISIEKTDFVVTLSLSDNTTAVVTDFELDTTMLAGTPNVGDYKIKIRHSGKELEYPVKIMPKEIDKPVLTLGSSIFVYDTNFLGEAREFVPVVSGIDFTTMMYSDSSVNKSSQAGEYVISVIPDANHIWKDYEDNNKEEVSVDWEIKRKTIFIGGPETLSFVYDGQQKTLVFTDYNSEWLFDDYFEVVDGDVSATDAASYQVVVSLKADKLANYEIMQDKYKKNQYEYNQNKTTITYFWTIA